MTQAAGTCNLKGSFEEPRKSLSQAQLSAFSVGRTGKAEGLMVMF